MERFVLLLVVLRLRRAVLAVVELLLRVVAFLVVAFLRWTFSWQPFSWRSSWPRFSWSLPCASASLLLRRKPSLHRFRSSFHWHWQQTQNTPLEVNTDREKH